MQANGSGEHSGELFDARREIESRLLRIKELVAVGRGADALVLLEPINLRQLPDDLRADALECRGDCLTELSRYAEAHEAYLQALPLRGASTNRRDETLLKTLCSAMRVLDAERFPALVQRLKTSGRGEPIMRYLRLEVERLSANKKCSWDYYLVGTAAHEPALLSELTEISQNLALGRLEDALELLYPLLAGGRLSLWLQAARIQYALQQDHQMKALLEHALEHFPDSWRLHYALGWGLELLMMHDRAEYSYRRALRLYPQSGEAWLALARVLRHQGLLDEAREATHEALRWCSESGFPLALREYASAETLLVGLIAARPLNLLPWRLWRQVQRAVKSLRRTHRFVQTCWERVRAMRAVLETGEDGQSAE